MCVISDKDMVYCVEWILDIVAILSIIKGMTRDLHILLEKAKERVKSYSVPPLFFPFFCKWKRIEYQDNYKIVK